MVKASWLWSACALVLGGAALIGADRAAAQECEIDADCDSGLICKSYGTSDCARPAPEPDCPEGEECLVAPPEDDCTPEEIKRCALPDCDSNADCPDGTVCHAETWTECSGGGAAPCDPGGECPEPEPAQEECVEHTGDSTCVPRYVLPCEVADDCGPGFTCEEIVNGWCSGSAGAPPPEDGGVPAEEPPPEEPTCGEERTGEFYCAAVEVVCTEDADCAEGWSCADNAERPVCDSAEPAPTPPPPDGGAAEGDSAEPIDDTSSDCGGESTAPEMVCVPPFASVGGIFGRGGEAWETSASGGVPASDDDSGADPQAPIGTPSDGDAESGMDAMESSNCSVAMPGTGGSAASVLALLGLGALLLRRRRPTA